MVRGAGWNPAGHTASAPCCTSGSHTKRRGSKMAHRSRCSAFDTRSARALHGATNSSSRAAATRAASCPREEPERRCQRGLRVETCKDRRKIRVHDATDGVGAFQIVLLLTCWSFCVQYTHCGRRCTCKCIAKRIYMQNALFCTRRRVSHCWLNDALDAACRLSFSLWNPW